MGTYFSPRMQPFLNKYGTNLSHSSIVDVRALPNGFSNEPVYVGLGYTLKIAVNFESYVNVDTAGGVPTLALNLEKDGGGFARAVYESGSGTKQLIFTYTVEEGDSTQGLVLDLSLIHI